MTSGDGNYKTFRIDKVKHPACAVQQNTYKVYKDERSGPNNVEFMAEVILVDLNIYHTNNMLHKKKFVALLSKCVFLSYFYRSDLDLDPTEVYWALVPAITDIWN